MKVGDRVRLIGIPPGLNDEDTLRTRTLFEKCFGKTFEIMALQVVEGLPHPLAQLDVGEVMGKVACLESIYVEPEYLEIE